MQTEIDIQRNNFWKYASSLHVQADLIDVFTKWAFNNNFSPIVTKTLWDSIQTEVVSLFKEGSVAVQADTPEELKETISESEDKQITSKTPTTNPEEKDITKEVPEKPKQGLMETLANT
jgi:hypothetical protein